VLITVSLGNPGIPRVIDALSTIMWPSMVRQTPKRDTANTLIGAIRSRHAIPSDDYDELARLVGGGSFKSDDNRIQRELEELERWLDEDAPSGDGECATDPWSTAVTPETASPFSPSDVLESSRPSTPKAGFDDDFASFVSASSSSFTGSLNVPSESSSFPFASTSFSSTFSFDSVSSGRSTPTFDDRPPNEAALGVSYRSLGSVSDFGEMDKETSYQEHSSDSGDDDDDDDIPSKAEIAETSRTIFGPFPLSLSPMEEQGSQSLQTHTAVSPIVSAGTPQGVPDEELDPEMTDADPGQFDLQSVLGALQGLKEEIAGMPDNERRRAAARVALGLVYGLS
jgi:hypothetical protein